MLTKVSDISKYARDQAMINRLKNNLSDLKKRRKILLHEITKIDRQIEKHEDFLDDLED